MQALMRRLEQLEQEKAEAIERADREQAERLRMETKANQATHQLEEATHQLKETTLNSYLYNLRHIMVPELLVEEDANQSASIVLLNGIGSSGSDIAGRDLGERAKVFSRALPGIQG